MYYISFITHLHDGNITMKWNCHINRMFTNKYVYKLR